MTRYRRLAAAATLLLVPALGACGFGAQTDQQYQVGAGTDNREAVVQILNAAIVVPKLGSTTGYFVGSFVNNSIDNPARDEHAVDATVSSITVAGSAVTTPKLAVKATSAYTPQPAAAHGNKAIPLTVPADLSDGAYVSVAFVIMSGGDSKTVTMQVPVFPANNQHSTFAQYLPAHAVVAPMPRESPSVKQPGHTSGHTASIR